MKLGHKLKHSLKSAWRNPLHSGLGKAVNNYAPFHHFTATAIEKIRRKSVISGHRLKSRLFGAGSVNSASGAACS